jgi:hypothetical protein
MAEPAVSAPAIASPPQGEFRVGAVLSRALAILSSNVLKFLPLTAITALPDLAALASSGAVNDAVRRNPQAVFTAGIVMAGLASAIVFIFLQAVTEAVVLYGSFQALRNRPVRIGESLQKGLSRVLPIVGLSLCIAIGCGFAFLLLIVPGIILMIAWSVALPACVVERLGPFQSMSRSSALTKGHRWKMLGILLIIMIGNAVVGGVLAKMLFGLGLVVVVIARMIWHALIGAYQSIVVAVAYHDLRVAKEGVDIENIASVFD